eukprot:Nk52_evm2s255 gene=Nk52_evmTU2s255
MGVKDKKGSKKGGEDPEQRILEYINSRNRPFSAIDIFNNLHGEIGKTQVVKSLAALGQSKKLIEKEYGKSKVYAPTQHDQTKVSEEEMKEMDTRINELKEQVKSTKTIANDKQKELTALLSNEPLEEIHARIEVVKEANGKLEKKLDTLKGGDCQLLTKEQINSLNANVEKTRATFRKRKRMCNNILDAILEGYPKSKKELYEQIGIEMDEQAEKQLM